MASERAVTFGASAAIPIVGGPRAGALSRGRYTRRCSQMFGSLIHSKVLAAGVAGVLALGAVGGVALAQQGPGGTSGSGSPTAPAHPRLKVLENLLQDTVQKSGLDKQVFDGKVKPERADALKTKTHQRIENFVNNGRPHKTK